MTDSDVRHTHREAHGQIIPIGGTFEVDGYEVAYPGQPVGPPGVWINCRCLARPTLLNESTARTVTATGGEMGKTATAAEEPEVVVDEAPTEDAPEIPEEDLTIPVPWHGILAPEGTPSGDGRQFADGALRHRELPLPLKFMPADAEGHDGSVIVGRIDRIWREDGVMKGEGVFDNSPYGYEAVRLIAERMLRGVSVDVDDATAALDDDGEVLTFSDARIAAATLCAIPAFAEAYVALGPWEDDPDESVEGDPEADAQETVAEASAKALSEDLAGLGAEVTALAISEGEWDGSASRFTDEQWHKSCLIHLHDGEPTSKSECKLPVKEPNGDLSRAGVHAAAARINQVDAPQEQIDNAKSALRSFYKQLDEDPPEDLAGETDTFAPVPRKTKDGPGWITHPRPTKRITDYWVDGPGAAKIGWGMPGDFNRCRTQLAKYVQNPDWLAGLCANLHYRALRIWPGEHNARLDQMDNKDTTSMTASVGLMAQETDTYPADWFRNPELTGPTPFTVTDEGRVFGHVATWNVCHIGIGKECVVAPKSATDYSYFMLHPLETDAGTISTGVISVGGGHAVDGLGIRPTMAHYDSTSTAAAYVTAGEDEFGIWVAGAVNPAADENTLTTLRSAVLSGDWREVVTPNGQRSMEMVAALAVNVPGFPIPRPSIATKGEHAVSLVAAGIPQNVADDESSAITRADLAAAVKVAMKELAEEEKRHQRTSVAKAAIRTERNRRARAAFNN